MRKCAYTGKDARAKDSVLPRPVLGEDDKHNWASTLPCNEDYKAHKSTDLPTELEMQANELFHLLELARLRVKYYEAELAKVQQEILKDYKEPVKAPVSVKVKKEIAIATVQKEVVGKVSGDIDELLNKKRKTFMDDDE